MANPLSTGLLLSCLLSSLALPGVASAAGSLDSLARVSEAQGAEVLTRPGARGTLSYVGGALSKPGLSPEAAARSFLRSYGHLVGVRGDVDLVINRMPVDRVGGQHVIFEQRHLGVPVYGARLALHFDTEGILRSVNSSLIPELDVDTRGAIPEGALKDLIRMELGSEALEIGAGTPWVRTTSAGSAIFAYQVPVWMAYEGDATPVSLWVDARSGEVLFGEDPLHHGQAQGTGIDVEGDDIPLNIYDGKNFRLKVSPILRPYVQQAEKGAFNLVDQTTKDLGWIYTWDSNETFMLDNEYVSSNDNTFDAPIDPGHPAGVSAHNYARQTLDYFWEVHGRKGLDDAGLSVASLVQISDPVPSYPLEINAGWAGYGFNFMIYGAGGEWPQDSGVMWRSFSASLDVIGHELSHGIGEFTVNLGYEHESGALNEHLADVFGVLVQSYWQELDWLMGEDLFEEPVYPYDAVRSFEDPPLYRQPDRMSTFRAEPLTYDAGGVHFNSGIGNKAFYLAVQGGTFNGVTVPAIDADVTTSLEIAGDIWFDVMDMGRIDPNSQLIDMRQATLDAASSVHPEALNSLRLAWNAVEVTDAFYPDSSIDTAEPNDYKGIATPITLGGSVEGILWNRADCDMYALEGAGDVIIRAKNLPVGAQLAVYKSGLFGILSNIASSDSPELEDESILVSTKAGTTYYIEVMVDATSQGDPDSTYTLEVIPGN